MRRKARETSSAKTKSSPGPVQEMAFTKGAEYIESCDVVCEHNPNDAGGEHIPGNSQHNAGDAGGEYSPSSPSLLPVVVDKIFDFAVSRGMKLNPKKCKEMMISFLQYDLQPIHPIYIFGTLVERVSCYKLLGVIVSQDLTWNSHVEYILKKANSRL